jgi:hypothetical protein
MTLQELIAQVRAAREAKITAARAAAQTLTDLRTRIDGDTPPTEDELRSAVETRDAADAEVNALTDRLTELGTDLERQNALDALQNEPAPAGVVRQREVSGPRAVVTSEERTYSAHRDKSFDTRSGTFRKGARPGADFQRDVVAAFAGNLSAMQRLQAHETEERIDRRANGTAGYLDRAVATSALSGIVVPQYLTEYYAAQPTTGRPFADICTPHPLPETGMSAFIGKVTTGTNVDDQASEGTAVAETDIDDTLLTLPIRTAAGQQTVSRQGIDRGIGTEDVILGDMYKRWASNLDRKLLNVATDGLTNVATAVTYTDATPTAAELWPKLLNAQADAVGALLDMATGPLVTLMHSRRWFWLQSQVGTSWPFIGQPGIGTQQGGVNYAELYGRGFAGVLPNGSAVVMDNNIATNLGAGTNEDEAYAVDPGECHLFEDPSAPMFIRAEQTKAANLQVLLVLYGYYAFTFARVSHARKVAGTGMVTPTF